MIHVSGACVRGHSRRRGSREARPSEAHGGPKGGHMKRLSIVAALVAIGVAVPLSIGSSHREAPLTSIDPTADDTDVYAYTAKDAPDALTIVANWVPFEDPAGGPNFYKFDPKARYYINVDNTGDGKYDVRYRFTFRDFREERQGLVPVRVPRCGVDRRTTAVPEAVLRRGAARVRILQERFGLEEGQEALAQGQVTQAQVEAASSARSACCAACGPSRGTSRWRRTTSGRRRSRTTRRSPTRRSPSCLVAARCSPVSVTTRSSSISG